MTPLPPLRQDLRIYPRDPDATGAPRWTLHDPVQNQFFHLTQEMVECLGRWSLGAVETIVAAVRRETTVNVSERDVTELVDFLQANDLSEAPFPADGTDLSKASESPRRKAWWQNVMSLLFFRVPLLRPERALERTVWIARIFLTPTFFVLTALAFVLAIYLILQNWDGFRAEAAGLATFEGLFKLGLAFLVVKTFHELAHAYVATHFGVRVPRMGLAFMVFLPIPYTDTTESWKLREDRARFWIAAAGISAELTLAVWSSLTWALLPDGTARDVAFLIATTTWISSLIVNLSPFLRFDGYFMLSDAWGLPNLHARSGAMARWWLREVLFAPGLGPPETVTPKRRRRMIIFAYLAWTYRLLIFSGIALLVYGLFFKLLGVLLLAVTLYALLLRPVLSEFAVWWQLRGAFRRPAGLLRFTSALALLIFLFAFPFSQSVTVPALYLPAGYQTVYSDAGGVVRALEVKPGAAVAEGQILVEIEAPEADRARVQNAARQISLSHLAQSAGLGAVNSEKRLSLLAVLEIARAEARALDREAAALTVRAPVSGSVRDVSPDLAIGQTIAAGQPLFAIEEHDKSPRILAFASEKALARLERDQPGHYYPNFDALNSTPVKIEEIALVPSTRLPIAETVAFPAHALGPLDDSNHHSLIEHVVRIVSTPEARRGYSVETPGAIKFAAEPLSLWGWLSNNLSGIIVREFGTMPFAG